MGTKSKQKRERRAGDRPSFMDAKSLKLKEIQPPEKLMQVMLVPNVNTYLRTYTLGECSVMTTREYGKWHLSISHPKRYPTWDECAEARYRTLPDEAYMVMALPPRDMYININKNCFQMLEIDRPKEIPS